MIVQVSFLKLWAFAGIYDLRKHSPSFGGSVENSIKVPITIGPAVIAPPYPDGPQRLNQRGNVVSLGIRLASSAFTLAAAF